jgi:hypothetical protein
MLSYTITISTLSNKTAAPGRAPKPITAVEEAFGEPGLKPKIPKLEDIATTSGAWHRKHSTGYPG